MNIWNKMEQQKADFTPKEMEIYNLVQKDPYAFTASTAMNIAKTYTVSQSAISRFCQKLGFNGFADFRLSMMISSAKDNSNTKEECNRSFSDALCTVITQIADNVMPLDSVRDLVSHILASRTIYTSGYGASSIPAEYFAFKMMLMNIRAHHIPSSREMETLHIINNKDTVILFSNSNPSHADFFSLIKELLPEQKPYIVLITGTAKHPFAKKCDNVITLPKLSSAIYPTMLDSGVAAMDFAQLMTVRIAEQLQAMDS